MDARRESEPTPMKNRTTVERKSERELVVTRTFNAPARLVFEAWTKPELLKRWWVPKSIGMSLLSCEADVRVGGRYRFVFGHDASKTMAFFGKYLEVTPHSRLVWTNEEGGERWAVTTVTFEEKGGKTLLVLHELYPSKEALDAAHRVRRRGCARRSGSSTSFSSPLAAGLNHGPPDLRAQRDAGRVLRPSRGDRGRRAARLLHAADGRSRGDAVRAHHLRADGERLAGGGARREGAARDAGVGAQAGGQAEVRRVGLAPRLPVEQHLPRRGGPARGRDGS